MTFLRSGHACPDPKETMSALVVSSLVAGHACPEPMNASRGALGFSLDPEEPFFGAGHAPPEPKDAFRGSDDS